MGEDTSGDPEQIGADIKACRNRAGLTQKDLAELIGCSPSHLSNVERGKRPASIELLSRMNFAITFEGDEGIRLLDQMQRLIAANGERPSAEVPACADEPSPITGAPPPPWDVSRWPRDRKILVGGLAIVTVLLVVSSALFSGGPEPQTSASATTSTTERQTTTTERATTTERQTTTTERATTTKAFTYHHDWQLMAILTSAGKTGDCAESYAAWDEQASATDPGQRELFYYLADHWTVSNCVRPGDGPPGTLTPITTTTTERTATTERTTTTGRTLNVPSSILAAFTNAEIWAFVDQEICFIWANRNNGGDIAAWAVEMERDFGYLGVTAGDASTFANNAINGGFC